MRVARCLVVLTAPTLALVAVLLSVPSASAQISGYWSYTGGTITSYSGPGGAVDIPSTVGGYPVTQIGSGGTVFWNTTNVTSVTVPAGVKTIENSAFRDCSALTNVSLPSTVTRIGDSAFEGCGSLTNIILPSSLTSLGNGAFSSCTNLTSASIPEGITSIGYNTFYLCRKLKSAPLPSGITSIGDSAFGSTAITNVTFPNTLTNIGRSAFQGCSNLSSVVIPSRVVQLGDSAFAVCSKLAAVTIAHGLTTIPYYTFFTCQLAKVTISASVTNIMSLAFFQGTNGGTFLFLGNAPAGLVPGSFPNSFKIYRLEGSTGFPDFVGGNPVQVTSLFAQAEYDGNRTNGRSDVTNNPANFNLFTKSQYDLNRTNGRNDVTAAPNTYDLFSRGQYDANRTNGRADVTNDPKTYNLYTSDSIMDLRMGGMMVQKQGGNAVVSFQPQTTTDLTQPFTNNGTPITNEISMPVDKGFIRIRANP